MVIYVLVDLLICNVSKNLVMGFFIDSVSMLHLLCMAVNILIYIYT